MAVETNYNVKVQLDPASFPTDNKVVIWDPDSGSFALTGSYGSGGGDQNLQEVTDIGNTTTTSSRFLFNQSHKYGNPLISQDATSGFYVDAADTESLAYTYVTPQPPTGKVGILSIPLTAGGQVQAHPNNYITIGGVSISDGGDTTHDPPSACAEKVSNLDDSNDLLTFNNATVNDVIHVLSGDFPFDFFSTNDEVILVPPNLPLTNTTNFLEATYQGIVSDNPQFRIDAVTWDSTTVGDPTGAWCFYLSSRGTTRTLTVGDQNTLGQIELKSTSSDSTDPRSGLLLTSAPNIYFFQYDAKTTPSGSLQPASASAQIGFDQKDGSLNFKVSGTSSAASPPKTMLYVSKSGDDARIGIGTNKPTSIFEVKTQQGSSKESPDFVLSVPSGSVATGQESSRIAFVIEDEALSGSKLNISGSTAAIYSKVLGSNGGYQYGSLVLEVDGGSVATQDTKAFEIGYGLNSSINGSQIGTRISSSIIMDGISTPSLQMRAGGNDIIRIGRDTTSPFTAGGELYIYYDGNAEVALRTYTEDSFISSSAGKGFGIGTKTPNAKLEVVGNTIFSGSLDISQSLTASGLYYPDTDGTDGQALITDGSGKLEFNDIKVYARVKNISGGTLAKGTPVHASASASPPSGNVSEVIPASASVASSMPATFVLDEEITNGSEGRALLSGFINGVDTSTFNEGDVVYVGENGGYTNVKPTSDTNLIQNLGIVTKVDASNGSGFIYGSGRSNDVPNLPTGKIWVGSDSYTVTSSVISLDETNKYVSGSESAKFQLGTYAFGYNTFPGFGFDITGSGIIVSSSLPDEHYPMVKIGETELLDLTTDTALSDHTFTIHNVDNFQVTSGSEPTEVSTNKLFEHIGDTFKVYSKGNSTPVFTASSSSIALQGKDVSILPSSGVPYVKIPNTSTTPQYVPVFDAIPNNPSGQELKYITASTFTGGGSSTPYGLGVFGGKYVWGTSDGGKTVAHGFVNGPQAGATQNTDHWINSAVYTPDSTTYSMSTYKMQYAALYCPVAGTPHIKAWGRTSDSDLTTNHSMSISLWSLDTEPANLSAGSQTLTLRAQSEFLAFNAQTIYYQGNGWEASGSSARPAGAFYFVTWDLGGPNPSGTVNFLGNFTIWVEPS